MAVIVRLLVSVGQLYHVPPDGFPLTGEDDGYNRLSRQLVCQTVGCLVPVDADMFLRALLNGGITGASQLMK